MSDGTLRVLGILLAVDQPAFVEQMDFELARARCPSFARFADRLAGLISQLTAV